MDDAMIVEQLDALAELQDAITVERMAKQAEMEKLMPAEVRAQLAGVEAEYEERIAAAEARAAAMKAAIGETVRACGRTVRGAHLMAVFAERTNWDGRRLAGYAQAHPEVLAFSRKTTTVSIRVMEK